MMINDNDDDHDDHDHDNDYDHDHDDDHDAHLSPLLQLLDDGDPPLLLVPLLSLQVLQQGS